MRTTLLAALLLGAAPLGAQQDSTARRDSLFAREQRRIQGERVPARSAQSNEARKRRIAAAIGIVAPADWLDVEGGNGLTMGTGPGVHASIDGSWPRFTHVDLTGTLRVSHAAPRLDGDELAGEPGGVTTVDLLVGLERPISAQAIVRGAIGGAFVTGPSGVDPWDSDGAIAPAIEASIALRPVAAAPWWFALGVNAMRYSGVSTTAESTAGTVFRPWLEVRYAF